MDNVGYNFTAVLKHFRTDKLLVSTRNGRQNVAIRSEAWTDDEMLCFRRQEDGSYIIESLLLDGKALCVKYRKPDNQPYVCFSDHQKKTYWRIEILDWDVAGRGEFILISPICAPNKVLGYDGHTVCIEERYDDRLQRFLLYRVSSEEHCRIHRKRLSEGGIAVKPLWGDPSAVNTDVFVIMPFRKELDSVYEGPIKKICDDMSLSYQRADDIFMSRPIMQDIWSLINNAKVIICDCTGKNPNVFYELGIAHTLGKQVVLLTQNVDDMPFDVHAMRCIQYEDSIAGTKCLEDTLKLYISKIIEDVD